MTILNETIEKSLDLYADYKEQELSKQLIDKMINDLIDFRSKNESKVLLPLIQKRIIADLFININKYHNNDYINDSVNNINTNVSYETPQKIIDLFQYAAKQLVIFLDNSVDINVKNNSFLNQRNNLLEENNKMIFAQWSSLFRDKNDINLRNYIYNNFSYNLIIDFYQKQTILDKKELWDKYFSNSFGNTIHPFFTVRTNYNNQKDIINSIIDFYKNN